MKSTKKIGRPRSGVEKKVTAAFKADPALLEAIKTQADAEGITRSNKTEQLLRSHPEIEKHLGPA